MKKAHARRPSKHSGWRRTAQNPVTDPARLLNRLDARRLSDLEHCRIAWEDAGDPLALAVAVTYGNLRGWLVNALLCVLFESVPLSRLWKRRHRASVDRHRATAAASAKVLWPALSWDVARQAGERLTHERFSDVSHVGTQAMKKAHRTVCRALDNPGIYYLPPEGFRDRLLAAMEGQLVVITRSLEKARSPK
jgi:hypothetical protein